MLIGLILAEPNREWLKPELVLELKDERIDESSGIAASVKYPGSYYTHNDSGDTARFFRFDSKGVVAEHALSKAGATDWEDMEQATLNGKTWLYFGDIGDNNSKRKEITVSRCKEPDDRAAVVSDYDAYTLTYPDGAHNCEALIVDPGSGDIYLATKASNECVVYRLEAPAKPGSYKLQRLGTIHPDTGAGTMGRLVTAGSADSKGKHVVLRTYSGALEFDVKGEFKDWWQAEPRRVNTAADAQGEAICYSLDGESLWTTSEGRACPVNKIRSKKIRS